MTLVTTPRMPFQNGYVTHDTDRAIAAFARYGVTDFLRIGEMPLEGADGPMVVRMSAAWAGDLMLEIFEPVGEGNPLYRDYLPTDGQATRLHHQAVLIADEAEWRATLEAIEASGVRTVLGGETDNAKYAYVDTRPVLGHYIEYLYYIDQSRSLLARMPRNPPLLAIPR